MFASNQDIKEFDPDLWQAMQSEYQRTLFSLIESSCSGSAWAFSQT